MELLTSATPNGWKVAILIEELREAGIALADMSVTPIDLMAGEQFSEAFTAVNPNQKIPALRDGNTSLMESCAILLYLAEQYPTSLLPQGPARWEVIQWVFWQAANLGPVMGNKLSYTRYMDSVADEQKSHPLERFTNEGQRLLRVLDTRLQDRLYICGDEFTLADIACYPWLRAWKWVKLDVTAHDHIVDWMARVRARPGVDRGLQYGVAQEDSNGWSQATKQRYKAGGSRIADNQSIADSTRDNETH